MAEAILRHLSKGKIDVSSAGSHPRPEIHPMARDATRKLFHVDMKGQHPKGFEPFLGQSFDYVISVCDRAAESCPLFPGDPTRIRWSLEDPGEAGGTDEQRRRAFECTAMDLMRRIRIWLALPSVSGRVGLSPSGHAV
jgi:protein-tyrosine-phosphatase